MAGAEIPEGFVRDAPGPPMPQDVQQQGRHRVLGHLGTDQATDARLTRGTATQMDIIARQHVLALLGAALRFAASGARTVVLGAVMPAPAPLPTMATSHSTVSGVVPRLPPDTFQPR